MKILDLSASNRAIWWDKDNIDTIYCDIRESVKPSLVCNTCFLPFAIKTGFDLIVFDPPHVNFGKNAEMSKTYGWHTTEEIRKTIFMSGYEAARVSKPEALMALKWNDHDQKIEKILKLLYPFWLPLFGHKIAQRLKHAASTQWVMLQANLWGKQKGFSL